MFTRRTVWWWLSYLYSISWCRLFKEFSFDHRRLKLRHTYALWLPAVSLAHLLVEVTLLMPAVAECSPNPIHTGVKQHDHCIVTLTLYRSPAVTRGTTIWYYLNAMPLLFMICKHLLPLLSGIVSSQWKAFSKSMCPSHITGFSATNGIFN